MSLRIYNTFTKTVANFAPLEANHVRMYVCGMTVYDFCHIGHARTMIIFDVVQRWLKASGYEVTYVRNITDIDDKIIKRAVENGESIRSLTDRMICALHEDCALLGIESPDHEPRAMDYVPQMLGLIRKLEDAKLAYQADNGDINYSVRKFPSYGRLSGKSLDELQAGERVAVSSEKRDPLDFVLWKSAKAEEPDDAKWADSEGRYGLGRPGWHIECSAMSQALLGESFDIHGGGADLQFPHHENEIAQSEGASGKPLAQVWMHAGFLNIDNEKMSKSLGNFFTIREVLQHYDAEVLRFFIVRSHYRSNLNYSTVHLDDAKAALKRLYTTLLSVPPRSAVLAAPLEWENPYAKTFQSAMNEDFGSPSAVAVLFDLAAEVNRSQSADLAALLKQLGGVLGLLQRDPAAYLQGLDAAAQDTSAHALSVAEIEAQITARTAAKAAKDFAQADTIRKALEGHGIILKDSPNGTTWERI